MIVDCSDTVNKTRSNFLALFQTKNLKEVMNSKKREFKREVSAFRIFKSLRNCSLLLACSAFLLAVSVNTVSAETTATQQQTVKINGTVTDASGEALIGVSVIEKGTSTGTVTDMDGAFTLNVAPNATIEATYVGYATQTLRVTGGTSVYKITMKEDTKSLDEVVVVGYGVQRKRLVTGATLQVSGQDIQKMSTTNAFTALQSKTPGVNIVQSNGQPGSGYVVNIRGIGTAGESRPLYIVDGVAAGNDALNNMSPSDIESIDVLKDAASAAIYGARAANGVILITTKQGKAGKTRISYDGYYGQQYMAKKPDLLNAQQYIDVQNEVRFNMNQTPYDWASLLPNGMYDDIKSGKWKGTDWIDAFYNKGAQTQNHSVNITGGNDLSKFSLGYTFNRQDGIFGEDAQAQAKRHTFRINSDYVLLKAKDFDAIKVGENVNYIYRTHNGISQGNIYWNAFHNILVANPLMPAYNADGGYYSAADKAADYWNFDGSFGNPIGAVNTNSQGLNLYKDQNLNASAYLEIQPIKNLVFKSQYGYRMSAGTGRTDDQIASWSNTSNTTTESVYQSAYQGYTWTLENTLTYTLAKDRNHFNFLIGQSIERSGYGENLASQGSNNIFDLGWNYAWVSNTNPTTLSQAVATGNPDPRGYPNGQHALSSFYGRVSYDWNETYMATVIMRADGSSNFARGHRWGYFPSVQAGWVLTNEPFLEGAKGTMDFLKLRASWGQNGNEAIDAFQYLATYNFPATAIYYFGDDKVTPSAGGVPGVLQNPNITWETNEMTNVGLDARFLNSRLGVTFDWYTRTTKNWLLPAPIAGAWGFDAPYDNAGDVKNSGTELSLSWNDKISDFQYGVSLNGSYNKNEVTKIGNPEGILHGPANVLSQSTSEFYRLQVGQPMGFFWGYKTNGIFQNWDEVHAYVNKNGQPIIPGAQPGDVRFVDLNGDGVIDEKDKTNIGCGWPTTHLGLNINLAYKGFDFLVSSAGAFGFQIAKSYRSFADSPLQNYTTDVFKRWTGEGTSNKWPRLTTGANINYQNLSDLYLENGNYVKIQNITLGYDFKRLFPQIPLSQARLYFSAQNLFTFTGYSGMDPEIGFNGGTNDANGRSTNWVSGIDLGNFPSAKTFLMGVNLTF